MLKIKKIFYSIQGEGPHIGMPAVFVRLSGCNLSCDFCDSKYAEIGEVVSLEEVIDNICTHNCQNVVITGGEPLLQPILSLIESLHFSHYKVFIETNGTIFDEEIPDFANIIVSPKLQFITPNYERNLELWNKMNAIFKFVVTDFNSFMEIVDFVKRMNITTPVYLMPETIDSEDMKRKLVDLAGWVKQYGEDNFHISMRMQIFMYGCIRGV